MKTFRLICCQSVPNILMNSKICLWTRKTNLQPVKITTLRSNVCHLHRHRIIWPLKIQQFKFKIIKINYLLQLGVNRKLNLLPQRRKRPLSSLMMTKKSQKKTWTTRKKKRMANQIKLQMKMNLRKMRKRKKKQLPQLQRLLTKKKSSAVFVGTASVKSKTPFFQFASAAEASASSITLALSTG